jgi:hypothetical protein
MQAEVLLVNGQIIVLPAHRENQMLDKAVLDKYMQDRSKEILETFKPRHMGHA